MLAGLDFSNDTALTRFIVDNARCPGSAGKILFPIPEPAPRASGSIA